MKKQGLMLMGMGSLLAVTAACGDDNAAGNEDAPDDVTLRLAHTGSGDHQYCLS